VAAAVNVEPVIVPVPSFPALLAVLADRGLGVDVRDGRLGIAGLVATLDDELTFYCRWYGAELRALVHGRTSGHVVGMCDECGEWCFIRADKTWRCRLTPGCPGRHRANP
jgi:hypothetical protein